MRSAGGGRLLLGRRFHGRLVKALHERVEHPAAESKEERGGILTLGGEGGGGPAHYGLALFRAAPHVITLALSPVDGVLSLLLLQAQCLLLCGAQRLCFSLTRGELLLRFHEGVGLAALVFVPLHVRR